MTSEVMSIRGMSVGQTTPEKLRQAIAWAFHEEGLTYARIARLLGVDQATVSRLLRLHRKRGDVTPRGGRQPPSHSRPGGPEAQTPGAKDSSCDGAGVEAGADDAAGAAPAGFFTQTKSLVAAELDAPHNLGRRRILAALLTVVDARRLVFVDKSFRTTSMTPVTGEVLLRFVRERLCPWLRPGDIVLLDNLGAYKVKGVRQAIEAVGACVVYLPTHSFNLNPVESWWSDIKQQARLLKSRARQEEGSTPAACTSESELQREPPSRN